MIIVVQVVASAIAVMAVVGVLAYVIDKSVSRREHGQ